MSFHKTLKVITSLLYKYWDDFQSTSVYIRLRTGEGVTASTADCRVQWQGAEHTLCWL